MFINFLARKLMNKIYKKGGNTNYCSNFVKKYSIISLRGKGR